MLPVKDVQDEERRRPTFLHECACLEAPHSALAVPTTPSHVDARRCCADLQSIFIIQANSCLDSPETIGQH